MPQTVAAPSPKAGTAMHLCSNGVLNAKKKTRKGKHLLQPHANDNLIKKKPRPSKKSSNVMDTKKKPCCSKKSSNVMDTKLPAKASVPPKSDSSAMGAKSRTKSAAKTTEAMSQVPPASDSKYPESLPPMSLPMLISSMPVHSEMAIAASEAAKR